METPESCVKSKAFDSNEEEIAYRLMYARWFCFCHIPSFCSTFKRYSVAEIFGRKYMLATFDTFRSNLDNKFKDESSTFTEKLKRIASKCLPKFLKEFEKALYDDDSPIWEAHLTIGPNDLPDFVTRGGDPQKRIQTLRAARLQDGIDVNG